MKTTTSVTIDAEIYEKAKSLGLSFSKILNFALEKRVSKGKSISRQIELLEDKKVDIEEQINKLKTIAFEQEKQYRENAEKEKQERLQKVYEVFRTGVYEKIKNDEPLEDVLKYIEQAKESNPAITDKLTKLQESLKGGLFNSVKNNKRTGD